jgi:shikimate dehydrogenase
VPSSPLVLTLKQVRSWDGPPLILFIGVSTGGSIAHTAFGGWASALGQPWRLAGLDLSQDTPAQTYQQLTATMHHNPGIVGAIITAHKLRFYGASADSLDQLDRLASLTREINTLATGDTLAGYARDALSLAHILPGLTGRGSVGALAGLHILCLGSGGAATALLLALHLDIAAGPGTAVAITPRADRPARVTFADASADALDALRSVAARAGIDMDRISFAHVHGAGDCDRLVAGLPVPGLVINATGLGKDRPGSPLTSAAPLGLGIAAWDLNYRGNLTFLHQAAARGARTLDGWEYFIAGWAGALTAIAGIPLTVGLLAQFTEIAAPHRRAPQGNLG